MFKEKIKDKNVLASLGCASVIFVLGVFILIGPVLQIQDFSFVYPLFFGIYALAELIIFSLSYQRKEYTSFFSFLISFLLFILTFVFDLTSRPNIIAFSLLLWILVNALVKLKRADYYHDKKSRMWTVEIVLLIIFFISGIMTSMNFAWGETAQILNLGYFVLICGILKIVELLILYLTKGKLK